MVPVLSGRALLARRCLLPLLVAACASPAPPMPTIAPFVAGAALSPVVHDDERELWAESDENLAKWHEEEWILEAPEATAYIDGVIDRLLIGELPEGVPAPRSHVVKHTLQQATAWPNGSILVTTALLASLDNEAQLAALLGHELAHFLLRHSLVAERYRALSDSTVARMRISREHETRADDFALDVIVEAGYVGRALAETLAHLSRDEPAYYGPSFGWESHPDLVKRIAVARSKAAHLPYDGDTGKERYEAALADLIGTAAKIEFDAGRFEQAKRTLGRHLRLQPGSASGHYLGARIAQKTDPLGRKAPAVRAGYEKAIECDPAYGDALRELGLLLLASGEREAALELLERYLASHPEAIDHTLIRRTIDRELARSQP